MDLLLSIIIILILGSVITIIILAVMHGKSTTTTPPTTTPPTTTPPTTTPPTTTPSTTTPPTTNNIPSQIPSKPIIFCTTTANSNNTRTVSLYNNTNTLITTTSTLSIPNIFLSISPVLASDANGGMTTLLSVTGDPISSTNTLVSPLGQYYFILQNDGNMCIYNTSDYSTTGNLGLYKMIWQSQTNNSGTPPYTLSLHDGIFDLKDSKNTTFMTSRIYSTAVAPIRLIMNDNRDATLVDNNWLQMWDSQSGIS